MEETKVSKPKKNNMEFEDNGDYSKIAGYLIL
jgi:hypothetical protein